MKSRKRYDAESDSKGPRNIALIKVRSSKLDSV